MDANHRSFSPFPWNLPGSIGTFAGDDGCTIELGIVQSHRDLLRQGVQHDLIRRFKAMTWTPLQNSVKAILLSGPGSFSYPASVVFVDGLDHTQTAAFEVDDRHGQQMSRDIPRGRHHRCHRQAFTGKPNETTVQKSKNVSTKIPSLLVLAAQGNKWKQRMNMEKPRIWETWRIVEWLHPHMEYLFIGIYCIYSDIYIYYMMSSCKAFFLVWLTGRYLLLLCMIKNCTKLRRTGQISHLCSSPQMAALQTNTNRMTSFQSKCWKLVSVDSITISDRFVEFLTKATKKRVLQKSIGDIHRLPQKYN